MRLLSILLSLSALLAIVPAASANPLPGAIFTTGNNGTGCQGVDLNIYSSKTDVWLDGGPSHFGAATLPDGSYYVQVTDPDGMNLLGTSLGTANERPYVVSGGVVPCINLYSILQNSPTDPTPGYLNTTNPGGEYKVWVSTVPSFDNDSTKTDNFKVNSSTTLPGTLTVEKCYDAITNGVCDPSDTLISGWEVSIGPNPTNIRQTAVNMQLAPGTYQVSELMPNETNWIATGVTTNGVLVTGGVATVTIAAGGTVDVQFGNVCTGAGGGLTLGFWSNKNGLAAFNTTTTAPTFGVTSGSTSVQVLRALNLVDAYGSTFDPSSYSVFRTWLLNATATNMSYMEGAQLATMALNVAHGYVNGNALVYAPLAVGHNAAGFLSVNALMADANSDIAANKLDLGGNSNRGYAQALKTYLDQANNNLIFVQSAPCTFTYAS